MCPQWGRFWLPPMKFLQLNFIPRSADLGLLVLRLWIGASMAVLHGWGKLAGFSKMSPQFLDFMGIGKGPSLALTVFAELAGAAFIVVGLWTRLSALVLAFAMGVAFWWPTAASSLGRATARWRSFTSAPARCSS